MGQWSNINNKKSLYERITGREEGREDSTAAYRSKLRSEGNTAEMDDLPDTRRGRGRHGASEKLSWSDRRDADRNAKRVPRRGKKS